MKRKSEILKGITKEIISSKFVGRNTLKINYIDNSIAYRLHNTDVVTFSSMGEITLNSAGWKTPTTKDRINSFSPFKVWQNKGIWHVHTPKGKFDFFDGITFSADGSGKGKMKTTNIGKINKVKKSISNFVSLITEENLPLPSSGDCFLCSLTCENGKTFGENRGDNAGHLELHLKERYLHGSLLVNAMKESGYRNEQISIHYHLKMVSTFKRTLRKYLTKNLIPELAR